MNIKSVCLIGGSGFLGRHAAELLSARGIAVRVPTRLRERAKDQLILLPTVEVVQADIHDPAVLRAMIEGCDAVVNLVGVLHDVRGDGFQRNHVELPARVASACRDAGVHRLVHVSAVGAASDAPSEYLRSKARGEVEITRAGSHGIHTTILRPSVIFGRGDRFLTVFAQLARLFPVLPLGCANARFQPVFVEDVAGAISRAIDEPGTFGKCFDLCGPKVYTLRELVELSAQTVGLKATVIPLPPFLANLQAAVLEHLPGRLMSRDNVKSMAVDNVCGCGFPPILGPAPTALESVAPLYLGQRRSRARYNDFRYRAGR